MFRFFCERHVALTGAVLCCVGLLLLVFLAVGGCSSTTGPGDPYPVGAIVSWGENDAGQCDVPAPNADFVAVAGGGQHSLGLTAP